MTRRRAIWLVIAGAAVVAATGLSLWAWSVTGRGQSPDDAAAALLRALESGDAEALAETGLVVSDDALTVFSAATAHITDAILDEVVRTGDDAEARMRFSLGGAAHTATVSLVQREGRWVPDQGVLGTVRLDSAPTIAVGIGATVVDTRAPVALLPAEYEAVALPSDLLDGSARLIVLPGATQEVDLEPLTLPAATEAAQRALLRQVESTCLDVTESVPDGCGIRIPWGTEFLAVDGIRSRIEIAPIVRLDGTAFTAEGGVLVATVSGSGLDGAARTATYRTASWTLRGEVRFSATGVELTSW